MKKLILLILSLLLFTGCGADTAPTEVSTEPPTEDPYAPIGDETTFLLPELPDIGEYEAGEVKRWYEGAMPELIASDEYGQLYPYLGKVQDYLTSPEGIFAGDDYEVELYGLCTADGVLVTDPVYTSVTEDNGYYVLKTEEASLTDGQTRYVRVYIAKSDGSAVNLVYEGYGDCTYCAPDVYGVSYDHSTGIGFFEKFVHADGSEYAAAPGELFSYDRGFIIHSDDRGDHILDKNLEPVYGPFDYEKHGRDGEVIGIKDGRYVIIDSAGKELYSSDKHIRYSNGCYFLTKENGISILDDDLSVVNTLTFDSVVYNVVYGYIETYQGYYTLEGEQTDIISIEYYSYTDTYILNRADSAQIVCAERSVTLPITGITEAAIYEDTVAVRTDDGEKQLYDISSGEPVCELLSFHGGGYETFEGALRRWYNPEGVLLCASREYEYEMDGVYCYEHNGVLYTVKSTGEVLVKIHSDTE